MLSELDGEHRISVEVKGTLVRIVYKVDDKPTVVAELNPAAAIGVARSLLDAIHEIAMETIG